MYSHGRIAGTITSLYLIECISRIAPGKIHRGNGIGALRPTTRITPEPAMDDCRFERWPRSDVEALDAPEVVSSNLHWWRSLRDLRIGAHCGRRNAATILAT